MRLYNKYITILLSQYKSRKNLPRVVSWILLWLKKNLRIGFRFGECNTLRQIDVVIPTISKDFKILNLEIESLKFIKHTINKIYIVAPKSNFIEKFCVENKLIFIDEISVLGFGKEYIDYQVHGMDRSGWMLQQLLKLSGDQFVEMDDYLVVDSDTLYVNEICFLCKDKFVFYASEEWHQPYFDSYKYLFGYSATANSSFVSHMMIFNKKLLSQMKRELESRWQLKWYDVFISTSSPIEESCVSEYETYANWVLRHYPEMSLIRPFFNKSLSRLNIDKLSKLSERYKFCHSVSFHSYLDN